MSETYLRTAELAALLRVRPQTVQYWRLKKRGPPYIKIGTRYVLYPMSEVERYIKERTIATRPCHFVEIPEEENNHG